MEKKDFLNAIKGKTIATGDHFTDENALRFTTTDDYIIDTLKLTMYEKSYQADVDKLFMELRKLWKQNWLSVSWKHGLPQLKAMLKEFFKKEHSQYFISHDIDNYYKITKI